MERRVCVGASVMEMFAILPTRAPLGLDFSNPIVLGITVGLVVAAGLLVLIAAAKALMQICPPNEVLIFSGRRFRMPDGSVRGYRVLFGGRGWRWPIVERVDRMSLSVVETPISIRGAYSRGGIPLNVEAVANIKISSDPSVVGNAIERFLGRDLSEIRRVAKETLEGHLRGVLATLTPEEVNEDRLKFAEELSRESEEDLRKLGLHVDTLKILHVADEVQYLSSIGRQAIASVIRDAEIAESDAKRAAEQMEAEQNGRANVAQATADAKIAQLRNELRKLQADLEAEVKSEEERTAAAAREARARAEQELQKTRAALEAVRLQADAVLPAEAARQASEYQARGEAAMIRERGRAVAEALEIVNRSWKEAGTHGLQIAIISDLENILAAASQGVTKIDVNQLHVIDSGDGSVLANYIATYPKMLEHVFQAIAKTTGIDVPKIVSQSEPPR